MFVLPLCYLLLLTVSDAKSSIKYHYNSNGRDDSLVGWPTTVSLGKFPIATDRLWLQFVSSLKIVQCSIFFAFSTRFLYFEISFTCFFAAKAQTFHMEKSIKSCTAQFMQMFSFSANIYAQPESIKWKRTGSIKLKLPNQPAFKKYACLCVCVRICLWVRKQQFETTYLCARVFAFWKVVASTD